MPAEKICVVCGTDCADRPRLKDANGRYACQDCVEAKRRAATGGRAQARPTAKPKPRPTAPAAGRAGAATSGSTNAPTSAGFSMDAYLEGVHTPDANPCPKCGAGRAADAVVCMQCGFDSASGRAMSTKVGKDKPKRARGSAPRVSGGMVGVIVALGLLALLPLIALASPEAAGLTLLVAVVWHLVAYVMMVVAAFRDDDRFWGIIGALFWIPLAGGLCALAFALYYCTIGSQRGVWKLNYWAAFFAFLIVFAMFASNNPDLFSGATPADTP